MKKVMLIVLGTALFTMQLFAGRYAGDFMMIGAGVRSMGMGGAFSALADDGSTIYWNPAGIAQIRESEVSAMHAFLYNGLAAYDNLSYCQPLPNGVTIGLNVTRLSVSDIPLFDESYLIGTNVDQRVNNSAYHLPGIPDGSFNSVDDMYQFAFAKNQHFDVNMGWLFFSVPVDIYLGGNVKFIRRSIMDNRGVGTGLDFAFKFKTDLGILFDWDELGKINLGVNFQDISGTTIGWDTISEHSDEVLFNTKLGVALEQPIPILKSYLTLAYDYDYVYDGCSHYGAEWSYVGLGDFFSGSTSSSSKAKAKKNNRNLNLKDQNSVSVRAGYYDENMSFGASVNIRSVSIDYALLTNPVGITNRIGLTVRFGRTIQDRKES